MLPKTLVCQSNLFKKDLRVHENITCIWNYLNNLPTPGKITNINYKTIRL